MIVGLAIREALVIVDPHLFILDSPEPFPYVPEATRFVVFIVLIIRFYIGSAVYFDRAYLREDADERYPKKSYTLDFLVGFVHFLFFFVLASSIEIHDKPRRLFPIVLLAILGYDVIWFLVSLKNDTRRLIRLWVFINLLTILLILVTYLLGVYALSLSHFRAEELAFIPVLIISAIDIAEITTQNNLFGRWLSRLIDE